MNNQGRLASRGSEHRCKFSEDLFDPGGVVHDEPK